MIPDRGPADRWHWPHYRPACRTGDVAGCCAVCYLRLVWFVLRHGVRKP